MTRSDSSDKEVIERRWILDRVRELLILAYEQGDYDSASIAWAMLKHEYTQRTEGGR